MYVALAPIFCAAKKRKTPPTGGKPYGNACYAAEVRFPRWTGTKSLQHVKERRKNVPSSEFGALLWEFNVLQFKIWVWIYLDFYGSVKCKSFDTIWSSLTLIVYWPLLKEVLNDLGPLKNFQYHITLHIVFIDICRQKQMTFCCSCDTCLCVL